MPIRFDHPSGEHLEACLSLGSCISKCMIQKEIDPEHNPRRELVQEVFQDSLRGLVRRHEAYPSLAHLAKGSSAPDHKCVLDLTDSTADHGPPDAGYLASRC